MLTKQEAREKIKKLVNENLKKMVYPYVIPDIASDILDDEELAKGWWEPATED